MAQDVAWRNRIVRYGEMPADQFLANPSNPRRHPNTQRDAMRGSFDTLGIISPVVVNARTGFMLDGHLRVEECLSRDDQMPIPFIEVDLSEDEEALALASFDWITQMATYDRDALDSLLRDVDTDNAALQTLLDDLAQQHDIDMSPVDVAEDQGAQIDKASELQAKWNTARGQVWMIPSRTGKGVHRLMCGDSASGDDVLRLMGGVKALLMVSDPPYNLAESWNGLQTFRGNTQVANDSNINFNEWFSSWIKTWMPSIDRTASFYIWYALRTNVRAIVENSGFTVHAVIIWVKEHFNVGRADYHSQYEPCLYFSQGDRHWCGRRDLSDIWHAPRVEQERMHPTQKPLSLIALSIESSSSKGDTVIDPFLGSGTTMVAAEQTGRICYGMEISEAYCAVCLQRLADMGLSPVLESSTHEIEF